MTKLEALKKLLENDELQIPRIRAGTRSGDATTSRTAFDSMTITALMRPTFTGDPLRVMPTSADRGGER